MGAQFTKHFYERMEKIMDEDLVEYPRQTGTEALAWARSRLNKIPSSVTIADVVKAYDTVAETVLDVNELEMYRSAFAVTQRLYAVAVAMQEQESANRAAVVEGIPARSSAFKVRAERSSMPRSGASTQTSDHATVEGRVFPAGDSRQGYPVVVNWRTSYDGHTRWIKIGKPNPDKAAGIFDAGGGVRVHTVDGLIFAVEIMDEPGK